MRAKRRYTHWTPANVAAATALLAQGMTYEDVARCLTEQMGFPVTDNVVYGLISRAGLTVPRLAQAPRARKAPHPVSVRWSRAISDRARKMHDAGSTFREIAVALNARYGMYLTPVEVDDKFHLDGFYGRRGVPETRCSPPLDSPSPAPSMPDAVMRDAILEWHRMGGKVSSIAARFRLPYRQVLAIIGADSNGIKS